MAWTEDEKERMREMWNKGSTVAEIAETLCRGVSSVKYHRKALGLPERRQKPFGAAIRVGLDEDSYNLFRRKARRQGQSLAGRLRALILADLGEP